jgi:hypothetical protein
MKRFLFFGLVIATFWSCSDANSINDGLLLEILPIESASLPDEMIIGETYSINYSYFRPSTCHGFNDLYYLVEDNIRTVAVINTVINDSSCQGLSNELIERSFSFFVQNNYSSIVFKFWQGKDENEQDTYLIFEVPIRQ